MQYVYILRCGADHYKVGVAKSVPKRIKSLQTSNPNLISIVSTRLVVDAYSVEQQLHQLLREFRTDGGTEWFQLEPEQALELAIALGRVPEVDVADKTRMLALIAETRSAQRSLERMLSALVDAAKPSKDQSGSRPSAVHDEPKVTQLIRSNDDDLVVLAIELFRAEGKASTSMLQRRMSIGYGRASRIMDRLQRDGLIGSLEGAHTRKVLT